jgi:hypothetical protein
VKNNFDKKWKLLLNLVAKALPKFKNNSQTPCTAEDGYCSDTVDLNDLTCQAKHAEGKHLSMVAQKLL